MKAENDAFYKELRDLTEDLLSYVKLGKYASAEIISEQITYRIREGLVANRGVL